MSDANIDNPPTVVIDDSGIGAWLGGVLSYYIRWSEIRRIQIDVIGYGEMGAEAFWSIDGEEPALDSPAFIAPVELVVGGDALTARLRSLAGFDEAAFQQAIAAEQRGEAGTFVCWHMT